MRHFNLGIGCLVALGCVVVLAFVTPSMARDWRHADSKLKISAELDAFDGKTVSLRLKGSDTVFDVPFDKLSAEDQAYLKKNYPNGKERKKKPADSPATESDGKPDPESAEVEKPDDANAEVEKPVPADAKGKKPAPASPRVARRAAARASTARPRDFNVEIVSLTITKTPKNVPQDNGGGATGLVPGTHATLLVSSRSKTLLRVDAEKTKIACADDRATNLSEPLPGSEAAVSDGALTLHVAPDGKSGTIVFDFPQPPTAKATRIRLKGELHLVCGSEENPETVTLPVTLIVSVGL